MEVTERGLSINEMNLILSRLMLCVCLFVSHLDYHQISVIKNNITGSPATSSKGIQSEESVPMDCSILVSDKTLKLDPLPPDEGLTRLVGILSRVSRSSR